MSTIHGPQRTRAFALFALALAVSLERKGMRVTRGPSALSRAKRATGLSTNNRAVQIKALTEKAEALKREAERSV